MQKQPASESLSQTDGYRLAFRYQRDAVVFAAVRAIILPLGLVAMPYLIRHIAASNPDLAVPTLWLEVGIVAGWVSLALGLLVFGSSLVRDIRRLLLIAGELKRKGVTVNWLELPPFEPSLQFKRYARYSALALGLSILGPFIDGPIGTLLKAVGIGGVVVLGVLLVATGEGVVGKHGKDT